ncbi:hypothetical protein [Streptomyces sp. NPDC048309]|uniref:hypothetical protein n=1 Tax=Streptomyces sp. NPDC048309 TaxID=3154618 RepID=UPI003408D05B
MSDGLAAAILGLLGALGGAMIGGLAAIRGARIGAERTAAAALRQSRDQANSEHDHWLRQERKVALAHLLGAIRAYSRLIMDVEARVRREESEADVRAAGERAWEAQKALKDRASEVLIIAEAEIEPLIHALADSTDELYDCMVSWRRTDNIFAVTDEARYATALDSVSRTSSDLLNHARVSVQARR